MLGLMSEEQTLIWLAAIFAMVVISGAFGLATIYYEQKADKAKK